MSREMGMVPLGSSKSSLQCQLIHISFKKLSNLSDNGWRNNQRKVDRNV